MGVTAGLVECNGSYAAGFMTHITCRLTVKNRDQLRNPTLGNRVWASFIINPSGNPLNQGPDLKNILRQSYDNIKVTIDSRQMCNSQDFITMNERLFIGAIHVQNRNIIFDIMFLSLLSYVLTFLFNMYCLLFCLQCFDAVGWVAGRASGL